MTLIGYTINTVYKKTVNNSIATKKDLECKRCFKEILDSDRDLLSRILPKS